MFFTTFFLGVLACVAGTVFLKFAIPLHPKLQAAIGTFRDLVLRSLETTHKSTHENEQDHIISCSDSKFQAFSPVLDRTRPIGFNDGFVADYHDMGERRWRKLVEQSADKWKGRAGSSGGNITSDGHSSDEKSSTSETSREVYNEPLSWDDKTCAREVLTMMRKRRERKATIKSTVKVKPPLETKKDGAENESLVAAELKTTSPSAIKENEPLISPPMHDQLEDIAPSQVANPNVILKTLLPEKENDIDYEGNSKHTKGQLSDHMNTQDITTASEQTQSVEPMSLDKMDIADNVEEGSNSLSRKAMKSISMIMAMVRERKDKSTNPQVVAEIENEEEAEKGRIENDSLLGVQANATALSLATENENALPPSDSDFVEKIDLEGVTMSLDKSKTSVPAVEDSEVTEVCSEHRNTENCLHGQHEELCASTSNWTPLVEFQKVKVPVCDEEVDGGNVLGDKQGTEGTPVGIKIEEGRKEVSHVDTKLEPEETIGDLSKGTDGVRNEAQTFELNDLGHEPRENTAVNFVEEVVPDVQVSKVNVEENVGVGIENDSTEEDIVHRLKVDSTPLPVSSEVKVHLSPLTDGHNEDVEEKDVTTIPDTVPESPPLKEKSSENNSELTEGHSITEHEDTKDSTRKQSETTATTTAQVPSTSIESMLPTPVKPLDEYAVGHVQKEDRHSDINRKEATQVSKSRTSMPTSPTFKMRASSQPRSTTGSMKQKFSSLLRSRVHSLREYHNRARGDLVQISHSSSGGPTGAFSKIANKMHRAAKKVTQRHN